MKKGNKVKAVIKQPRLAISFLLNRFSRLIKSDELYYKLQYYSFTGKWLNISNPTTYVEKMQWLKVHDRKPIYTTIVDKLAVKDYVAQIIGDKYIVPLLGVWETPDLIDYDKLPNQFVLKATHGGGARDVVICRDKDSFNKHAAAVQLNKSLNSDYWRMREWQYKDVPRKIIAEKYLEDESGNLNDYKVMCFGGVPKLIQVHRGRFTHQTQDFFDVNWNKLPIGQREYPCTSDMIAKPSVLEEMLDCSKQLSQGLIQVRVDWYIVNGKLYFGELTLTDSAGYADFIPEEWDKKVADMIKLPL